MKFKYFAVARCPYYKIPYVRIGGGRLQMILSPTDISVNLWRYWFRADWNFECGKLSNIKY
jgi:hypothetical protein